MLLVLAYMHPHTSNFVFLFGFSVLALIGYVLTQSCYFLNQKMFFSCIMTLKCASCSLFEIFALLVAFQKNLFQCFEDVGFVYIINITRKLYVKNHNLHLSIWSLQCICKKSDSNCLLRSTFLWCWLLLMVVQVFLEIAVNTPRNVSGMQILQLKIWLILMVNWEMYRESSLLLSTNYRSERSSRPKLLLSF